MLDISTLRVNDKVRLLRPVSGNDIGTIGTVVRVLRARERDGKEVPAVIVAWHPPSGGAEGARPAEWDAFTQHEQAMHAILEKADPTSPLRVARAKKVRLREEHPADSAPRPV